MKVNVKIYPNAKREKIVEEEHRLKVYVNCAPEKGKANKRVCELLAKHFGVRKSAVNVMSGLTSQEKIIEICK